jgi:antitoxin component of RelBE/YafQ-DinJ toxin-antitoxin module
MEKSALATFRVDPEVWKRFKAKCCQNGKRASQVLTDFLESYIEDDQTSGALEQLEGKLTEISTELAQIKAIKQNEESDRTEPRVLTGNGLTQSQICKLFGLQRNNLARDARKAGLPVEVYLSQKTKATYDPKTKKYYV